MVPSENVVIYTKQKLCFSLKINTDIIDKINKTSKQSNIWFPKGCV